MTVVIQKYLDQFEAARATRSDIEPIWEEIDKLIYGKQKKKEDLQDFSIRRCRNQLASHLQNTIITPGYPWFGVSLISDHADGYVSDDEEGWRQDIETTLIDVFNNCMSNFTTSIREFFLSLCGYGTACLMAEENEYAPYKVFFKKNFCVSELP